MTRSYEDELEHRIQMRHQYLEDPRYRKLSDIIPLASRNYSCFWDDIVFIIYISGVRKAALNKNLSHIKSYLDNGHELPINWRSFYDYFDNALKDSESVHIYDLHCPLFESDDGSESKSIKDLLDEYREKLLNTPYDIV